MRVCLVERDEARLAQMRAAFEGLGDQLLVLEERIMDMDDQVRRGSKRLLRDTNDLPGSEAD